MKQLPRYNVLALALPSPLPMRRASAALFAVTAMAACSASTADHVGQSGQPVAAGAVYNCGALAHPGSCMDVNADINANGTQIQEWRCNGGGAQSFRLQDAGNGAFAIVNTSSGKCVDVSAAGTANGTRIQLYDCNGSGAQSFFMQDAGGTFVNFVNTNSKKCLDVTAANPNDGTPVQLYDCNQTSAQTWNATEIQGAPSGGGGGGSAGGPCTGAALARCNCPSGYSCCPTDGSCFASASQVVYTMCKDDPGSTCTMGGGSGGTGGGGGATGGNGGGGGSSSQPTRLRVTNKCSQTIWLAHSDNVPDAQNVALATGQSHDVAIPAGALSATRFWPKVGCDGSGHSCSMGDNGQGGGVPCPANGCQPPLDSKFEASFAADGSTDSTWYNLSQVDGYTLPFAVTPSGPGAGQGSCVASDCSRLSLDQCPSGENMSGSGQYPAYANEDLRVRDGNGNVVACMAPCKKWNYPAPYGLGQPEGQEPGLHMCCPTPIDPATGQCTEANACMTSQSCNDPGDPVSVVHTGYVAAIRSMCPSAYSFAYDDAAGLHACPSTTSFEITFCP